MCVHIFCRTQYSTEQFWLFSTLTSRNHHSSDAVYWRGGGLKPSTQAGSLLRHAAGVVDDVGLLSISTCIFSQLSSLCIFLIDAHRQCLDSQRSVPAIIIVETEHHSRSNRDSLRRRKQLDNAVVWRTYAENCRHQFDLIESSSSSSSSSRNGRRFFITEHNSGSTKRFPMMASYPWLGAAISSTSQLRLPNVYTFWKY